MKSSFWLTINDDKSTNTAATATTSTNSITTNEMHIQSTYEEQQSIIQRSQTIMNNNNMNDAANKNPLRRKKMRTKLRDRYQIERTDSNISTSSFQSEISAVSSSSQHQEYLTDHCDLLDNNDGEVYFINNIKPCISEDSYQSHSSSRYVVETNSNDEIDTKDSNLTEQRREELLKAARERASQQQKCKEEKKMVIDIAFEKSRKWECVHDEMLLKNDDTEKDCLIFLELDRNFDPTISETLHGIEISTSNLDLLEIRDEEPVTDTSSLSSNTSSSTITSCLREPRIWNTKAVQQKDSADSEYMFDLGEEYESLIMFDERSRSVKFSGCFEIRECPSVEAEHKPLLFYTKDEMQRFRQDYYREVDAVLDGEMNLFDSVMESIDNFLCNSQPCGGRRSDEEHLVEA